MPSLVAGFPVTNYSGAVRTQVVQSITVPAGLTDTALVVTATQERGSATGEITSADFNGDALSLATEKHGTTWSRAEIWVLANPDVGTFNLTVNKESDSTNHIGIAVYLLEGVDQTTIFRTPNGDNSDSAAAASCTVAGVVASDYLIDILSLDGTGHSAVAGAGQVQGYGPLDFGSTTNEGQGSHQTGTDGVMSWTWTTAGPYSHAAIALINALVSSGTVIGDGVIGAGTIGTRGTSGAVSSKTGQISPKALLSGADVLTAAETGQTSPKAKLSAADVLEASETGALSPKAFASAADVSAYARQALFGPKAFQSGSDAYTPAETGTMSSKVLESGDATYEAVETGTIAPKAFESGQGYTGVYQKTGTISPKASASGADVAEFTETGKVSPKASESGGDTFESQETGTVQTGARLSGSKTATYTEQGSIQPKAKASASDSATLARAGQISPKAALSGGESRANTYVKTGTVSVKVQTSATDAYEATETGQVSARVQASAADVSEVVRTGTLSAVVTLGAQKEQTFTKAGTLEVKAYTSAEDTAEFDRAGTVSAVVVLSGPGFSADLTVPEYPELVLFTYHHAATSLWLDENEQTLELRHEVEDDAIDEAGQSLMIYETAEEETIE